jgi:cytochrome b561
MTDATTTSIPIATRGYDAVYKLLHWLLTLLILAQIASGLLAPDITSIDTVEGTPWVWHLSLGPTILVVALLHLYWRLSHPVPVAMGIPSWQRSLARVTHIALTWLAVLTPLFGWFAASYNGVDARLFGFITLPRLPEWEMGEEIHVALVWIMIGFLALHVAGALQHWLIRRDRVMQRML